MPYFCSTVPPFPRAVRIGLLVLFCAVPAASIAEDITREELLQRLDRSGRDNPTNLTEVVLRGADLSGVDFRGANMRGADFKRSGLSGADFSGANLDLVILSEADLRNANLEGASVYGGVLPRSDLSGANLRGTKLLANVSRSTFDDADMENLMAGANMGNQSMGLIRINLKYASLAGSNLKNADLRVCDARFAKFINADMQGADLSQCDLRRADFSGANMKEVNLSEAKINGAVFDNIKNEDSIIGLDSAVGVEQTGLN